MSRKFVLNKRTKARIQLSSFPVDKMVVVVVVVTVVVVVVAVVVEDVVVVVDPFLSVLPTKA